MSSWIDVEANRKRLQQALADKGLYKGAIDGILGQQSLSAMQAFERSLGFTATSYFDPRILPRLGLTQEPPMAENTIISGITATGADYLANFISSKIVWVSGIVVVALDSWVTTHWGLSVPDTVNGWVTAGIATVGGLVVMWLRTFANKPKVVAGTTVTVTK